MPKRLTIEKLAKSGELVIRMKDGRIHIEGEGSLDASDWERIGKEFGLIEDRQCGHWHYYPYWSGSLTVTTGGTTRTSDSTTWTSDTGTSVIVMS